MVVSLQFLSLALFAVLQCRSEAVNSVQSCSAGHYLEANNCVACPKGHFCHKNASPVPCPPGTCGHFEVRHRESCYNCPAGYYQNKSGQDSCNPCPEGHQCPKSDAAPVPCAPGTVGNERVDHRVSCWPCPSGSYQDKSGQRQCMWCPDGYFCQKSDAAPVPCAPGTVGNERVDHRISCWPCPSGSYQDKSGQQQCMWCPDGYFCPKSTESRPYACPTGYRSHSRVGDRAECYRCPAGYYRDRSGQDDCMPCPDGHYCPTVPDSRPVPCPAGTASHRDVGDRTNCYTSPRGYYQDKVGQAHSLYCPEGHYCLNREIPPQPCPPGHVSYRDIGDRTSCWRCPSGYFQDKSGQTSCIGCPDGHHCAKPDSRPLPCPSGFTSSRDISDRYQCYACAPGQCTAPVQPMVQCSSGSVGTGNSNCAPCPFDTYQDQSGQIVCKVCPDGHYCFTSSAAPVQCPPGSYSTKYMTNRSKCLPCNAGEYQNQAGQSVCLTCPNGHYCPNAATPPIRCPVGTYSTTAMQDRLVCAACPKGTYQDETGQWHCKTCPAGHLCPTPDVSPIQCPPGTYSTTSIQIRTACQPCPPGTYQDQCGQSTCKTCSSEHCPNLWAAAACPSLKSFDRMPDFCSPGRSCPNLKEISDVSAVCIAPPTPNRYSGQPVQSVLGNKNASYEVVHILPEHRTPTNKNDTTMTVPTAQAFDRMATAASVTGVDIRIESGFRSLAHQQYLWDCWNVTKLCIFKAAKPGTSNHGTGAALDLNTKCGLQSGNRAPLQCASSAVYNWLLNNAHNFGFIRTVQEEPHHWEYKGGSLDGPADFSKFE